ncbi:MBL fold metallo-hydrolase [Tropicimonas marinistellae]|uniref:MBL fold metallo-hydrolase n=1 Tax=Tropicimonas marinistellae TaxID=1739787 RepID=UPI00082AFD74|nr:MBL fold metallo-hydrolase [Tropicimonas marinistellae]
MTAQPALTRLEPGLRCLRAPNPSPMTEHGTNTYVIGEGNVAVIDPGPALPAHYDALLAALSPGERITHIFVTHSHLDHSPLARPLSQATGAPVLAFGPHGAGRSDVMVRLAADGLAGGGEGADEDFAPEIELADGEVIDGNGWRLQALHTPGHTSNHLAFAWGDALFTGDHVMGWASSLVSPPDGDLSAFMASCGRLASRSDRIYYPGHGAPVDDPAARVAWLIAHRRGREAQILEQLGPHPQSVSELTATIYTDTPDSLRAAAERNVFAHLIDLAERNLAHPVGPLSSTTCFTDQPREWEADAKM